VVLQVMSVFLHEANDVGLQYGAPAWAINLPTVEDRWLMCPHDK